MPGSASIRIPSFGLLTKLVRISPIVVMCVRAISGLSESVVGDLLACIAAAGVVGMLRSFVPSLVVKNNEVFVRPLVRRFRFANADRSFSWVGKAQRLRIQIEGMDHTLPFCSLQAVEDYYSIERLRPESWKKRVEALLLASGFKGDTS
jgi:hypothetical protein